MASHYPCTTIERQWLPASCISVDVCAPVTVKACCCCCRHSFLNQTATSYLLNIRRRLCLCHSQGMLLLPLFPLPHRSGTAQLAS